MLNENNVNYCSEANSDLDKFTTSEEGDASEVRSDDEDYVHIHMCMTYFIVFQLIYC